jgi:hypothetical protein
LVQQTGRGVPGSAARAMAEVHVFTRWVNMSLAPSLVARGHGFPVTQNLAMFFLRLTNQDISQKINQNILQEYQSDHVPDHVSRH